MASNADLMDLGEEIFKLIEKYKINPEGFTLNIRVDREEYDRIKQGFADSQKHPDLTIAVAKDTWSIQLLYPTLPMGLVEKSSE